MKRPLVAVLLGTDHHAFDRLVALAESASETMNADWFVQHGYSMPGAKNYGTSKDVFIKTTP